MDGHVTSVGHQVSGVMPDLGSMREDLNSLQTPLHALLEPLNNVAVPLEQVRHELADMRALLATVLASIFMATICIAIGTPIAAVLVYKNRHRFFPNIDEKDFPGNATIEKSSPQTVAK
jgi:hypothetical protein